MTSSPEEDPNHPSFSFEESQILFLFTSLTAGSSHVITATSRLETILKANRIPFRAIDTATNEKARRIWGRRAGKKKLPGLVREGWIVGDYEEVEEWNEYGELKEQLAAQSGTGVDSASTTGISTPANGASTPSVQKENVPTTGITMSLPIREQVPSSRPTGIQAPSTSSTTTLDKPASQHIRLNTSSPTPTRDMDDIVSPSEAKSQHNTSYITTLPPIRRPSGQSTPTTTKPTDLAKSPNVPDPPVAASSSKNASSNSSDPPGGAPSDTAGPASKSGLDAVTNHPDTSDAAVAFEQIKERGRGQARQEKAETVEGVTVDFVKGAPGSKVKWSEDQLKGAAGDGDAAEESVLD
jgi:hypothetical protein